MQVQDTSGWALTDTGSSRNLLSEDFFRSLPIQPKLAPAGSNQVDVGNEKLVKVIGWTLLKFEIADHSFYHILGVVKDLPVRFQIGTEILRSHSALLQYYPFGGNTLSLSEASCDACNDNLLVLSSAYSSQLTRQFNCPSPRFSKSVSCPDVGLTLAKFYSYYAG